LFTGVGSIISCIAGVPCPRIPATGLFPRNAELVRIAAFFTNTGIFHINYPVMNARLAFYVR
jgi:hypothetical protein